MSLRNQYPDVQAYFKYIYKDVLSTDFLLVTREKGGYLVEHKRNDKNNQIVIIRHVHIGDDRHIFEAINGKWVLKK